MKGRQHEAANPIRGHRIFPYRPQQERRENRSKGDDTTGWERLATKEGKGEEKRKEERRRWGDENKKREETRGERIRKGEGKEGRSKKETRGTERQGNEELRKGEERREEGVISE